MDKRIREAKKRFLRHEGIVSVEILLKKKRKHITVVLGHELGFEFPIIMGKSPSDRKAHLQQKSFINKQIAAALNDIKKQKDAAANDN